MNIKFIFIVLGEPYSVFSEVIGKYFSKIRIKKKKIVIFGDVDLLKKQLDKLNYKISFNKIKELSQAKVDELNIIHIKFGKKKIFSKISTNSNNYIESSFNKFFEVSKECNGEFVLINGPVSKKTFLKKKHLGITEYLSNKTKSDNELMLIYNNKLSVSPITTHLPIKYVAKKIYKKKIMKNVIKIDNFYKNSLKKKAKFAILGLNPHCETVDKYSEEENIIIPAIKNLKKKKIFIKGPFSADTFFIKNNMDKYNIVIGMYHDQVLVPIKTLFNFNAINITLGLPFLRISPDHGPNNPMLGKNISDPTSFFYAMNFINKLK